jgi:predicted nucleic acid-binding protein
MKELFPSYYTPSEEEISLLWKNATFVFDTSVLLQLYRVPDKTQQQAFSILERLKGRVWIPYHVALEYHRGRVRSILEARDGVEKLVSPMHRAFEEVERAVGVIKLEERGLKQAVREMEAIKKSASIVIAAAEGALASHIDPAGADPVADRLASIFAGAIGPAPTDQAEVKRIEAEAALRFAAKMGPGYKDEAKGAYTASGLRYDGKSADYIIWRQTMDHIKGAGLKDLIFVTRDAKPDWWLKHNETVWGPLPEMHREMMLDAALDRFWMYSLDDFLDFAGKKLQVAVSVTTLKDIKRASEQASYSESRRKFLDEVIKHRRLSGLNRLDSEDASVAEILREYLASESYSILEATDDIVSGVKFHLDAPYVGIAILSGLLEDDLGLSTVRKAFGKLQGNHAAQRWDIYVVERSAPHQPGLAERIASVLQPVLADIPSAAPAFVHVLMGKYGQHKESARLF